MPLRIAKRFTALNAVTLFSVAITAAIVGVYFIFDFYLCSVSRELMGSWLQSEAVAIQEGNLLTSITKNQRVLLSSQFVKGVALFDISASPPMRLIEVGQRIEPVSSKSVNSEKIQVVGAGFFNKQSIYRIPNKPDLLLVFDVESGFLQKFFFATVASLLLFIIILFGSIKAVQRREFWKREEFLKQALNDFIEQEQPSNLVEERLPFLVQWWKEKKAESERAKRHAIENESKILLGELAARVAHDIRSPLNTINAVTAALKNIPENNEKLLKGAIQRIRDIANGIGDQNKQILALEMSRNVGRVAIAIETETALLFPILESIVSEKRAQHQGKDLEIELDVAPAGYSLFAKVNELELRRTLANLIENAVEAVGSGGRVQIGLSQNYDSVLIDIKDNGKGISQDLLPRIGEKGFSFGKEHGSGLGVYYAKETVRSWGGRLEITSQDGVGTSIMIVLSVQPPPSWFAQSVQLSKGSTVVILDDDPTIHAAWQERMKEIAGDLSVQHFFDPQSALSWFVQNREKLGKYCILSDYELRARGTSGLDVIERLGVNHQDVLLVTSAFEDKSVRSRCNGLKIKILPKPALAHTPIGLV
ncbi:MAG: hybrid sensor histidine kinase/response regulator [Bdellovibrionales bacterium]|nr:hybrid sensor histidine kinase/response regulator [Bdellovibrionales bacterium]